MKTLQIFTDDYLAQVRSADPLSILEYLEDFRLLQMVNIQAPDDSDPEQDEGAQQPSAEADGLA